MSDTMTTPKHADRPPAGDEAAKPIAPLWIFKAMNPIMKGLLRSPLHRLLSRTLMLLTYTGRKTGKPYTIPIGYFVWDTDELIAFSSARWYTNLRDGKPVTLLLQGRQVEAVPTVIRERDAVIKTLEAFIKRLGWQTARKLMLGLPADREPTQADLGSNPAGHTCIHFTIVKR
jgi:F420H(2)-dependent quinone reductase